MIEEHMDAADGVAQKIAGLEAERAEMWASGRAELARDLMNQLTAFGFSRNVLSQIRDRLDALVG